MVYEKTKYNFIFLIIKFLLSYIRYFFLTTFIIFVVAILLFILLIFNPDFSFAFLKYFSFINQIYNNAAFTMSKKELIQIFSIVSFLFMIAVSLIKMVIRKLFDVPFSLTAKRKRILFFTINSIIYLIAIFIFLFSTSLEKSLVFILIIFYVVSSIFMVFYFLFEFLLDKLSKVYEKIG